MDYEWFAKKIGPFLLIIFLGFIFRKDFLRSAVAGIAFLSIMEVSALIGKQEIKHRDIISLLCSMLAGFALIGIFFNKIDERAFLIPGIICYISYLKNGKKVISKEK